MRPLGETSSIQPWQSEGASHSYGSDDGIVRLLEHGSTEHVGTGEPNQADVPQKRRRTMLVVTTLIVVPLIGLAIMAWPRDQPNDHRSASSTAAFGSSASVPASNDLDVLRTDQSQATPSSTGPATTEQESPPAVPVVPPEDPQALESLERLLAATVDAIGSPAEGVTGSLPDLSGIATGALLGELEPIPQVRQ